MILAGDLGGTKTILALFEVVAGDLRQVAEQTFPSQRYGTFASLLQEFRRAHPETVRVACLGVAGPILDGRCRTTNLPWTLDARELAEPGRAERVRLMNDLEATAYGCLHLPADATVSLTEPPAEHRTGTIAVIAAGTGLGQAVLCWDGSRHVPMASEGGHTDFAPRDETEIALLRHLWKRLGGHVSYERIVSGPGLVALYEFLLERDGMARPSWLDGPSPQADPAREITERARHGSDPRAGEAMQRFVSLYGGEAGNLALKCLATGGVFVAGGIAPRILPFLQDGPFLEAFRDKGRFRDLLSRMPVTVALEPRLALLGAARFAQRLEEESAER